METRDHFEKIFWFIVGLCLFGAFLTIYLINKLPAEDAVRVADTSLIFWLSTAVSGGIGYLIGSSANKSKVVPSSGETGTTSVDLQVTQTNTPPDPNQIPVS